MTSRVLAAPVALCALCFAMLLPLHAQEAGYWRATSSDARGITGDIALADTRLTINFLNFPIAQIRALSRDEMMALFNPDNPAAAVGHLYKLEIPAERKFLRKNTLCGSDNVEWMATAVVGRDLRVALFSSKAAPTFTIDALQNSSDTCGTFTYAR